MLTKRRAHEILEAAKNGDKASRAFDIFLTVLICVNIVAVIFETVKSIETHFAFWFRAIDLFSVLVFTIEYILRVWSCTVVPKYVHPLKGRLRFATSPLAIIDLLAILPFYLPLLLPIDLRFVRALRLFRLLRVFKLSRYSEAMRVLGNVVRSKKEELAICIMTGLILLIISSSIMYFVENEAQPDQFSSIPSALWWGVATLTTVGYGDIYPVTAVGRIIGALVSVLGIGMFALPAGILASGFAEEIRRTREKRAALFCPHCGLEFNPHQHD
jgi:voltage-gated potassium channel